MKKLIKDYDNYEIYEDGSVYNLNTKQFLKGSISEHGYKYYRLSKNNQKKMFYAHRLVAEHFINNPQNLPVVNHIDGNKLNNHISNLEWITYSDNTLHWKQNLAPKQHKPREYYLEDLPKEEWKEYSNYMVSSCGRVRHKINNNILRPSLTCGYHKVRLSQNGLVEDWLVHKLVYALFTGDYNFEGYVIDHIDGNKLNNAIDNLRKVTESENIQAAYYTQKTCQTVKPVMQLTLDGKELATFPSAAAAARDLNLDASTITKVCRGNCRNKSHGGFKFKYI